jgi:hypothetical protein
MLRKAFALLSVFALGITYSATAKVWRVNNNAGVNADFTTFNAAATSGSVVAGDTLYMEPSATQYSTGSFVLAKRLVVIGPGYFLDPANTSYPYNAGLQAATKSAHIAFFRLGTGADGSKFLGVSLDGSVYINGVSNIQFEKVFFGTGSVYFESGTNDNISFRKCFTNGGITANNGNATLFLTNIVIENTIFDGGYTSLEKTTGSGNIYRNNSSNNVGNTNSLTNFYVANNIFGVFANVNFLNCTIKNNLFATNQPLPGTATNNLVSVVMTNVYTGGTGSIDGRYVLKAGSPAIGAGLTVGAVVSPDCGAYGATDPYKLSGIPNIPSIYSFTVPTSVPSGSATMNVTFSTRNNN